MLVGLDGDHTLRVRHLHRGIGTVDDCHKLQEKMPFEDAVVPDVKAGYIKHLIALVVSCSIGHL
jgi:hypothetical protein